MSVKIKNVVLGDGITKVCLPIIATTKEDILNEARDIVKLPVDIVEWRADFFEHVMNLDKVLEVLDELSDI